MVESRRGGETGVSEIQLLEGDAVWQAAADGRCERTDAVICAAPGHRSSRILRRRVRLDPFTAGTRLYPCHVRPSEHTMRGLRPSPQPGVFRPRFVDERDPGVGVFPQRKQIVVDASRLAGVARERQRSRQL